MEPERRGPGRPRLELVGYRAAHKRIESARGRAVEHECFCCGQPAEEWALMAGTANLLWEDDPDGGQPKAYSLDVEAYQPMTKSCHRTYDGIRPPTRGTLLNATI